MSNDVTAAKPAKALDEFANWTDEVEGDDDQQQFDRAIVGQRIKFTNEGHWVVASDTTAIHRPLIVVNARRAVVKWSKDGTKPADTRFLGPGQKMPNIAKWNEDCPKDQWRKGFDGKLTGPYDARHYIYMLDPINLDQFTWSTNTIGGERAARELIDKILWMRRFKGDHNYPLVKLLSRYMPTKYGGRQRPHFDVIKFVEFDVDRTALPPSDQRQLPSQDPAAVPLEATETIDAVTAKERAAKVTAAIDAIAKTVEPPSRKEDLNDEVPF